MGLAEKISGFITNIKSIRMKDSAKDSLIEKARSSGDPHIGSPYYDRAEPYMDQQWETLIWPMIQSLDFSCVVDLAAGHGRNSAKLCEYADKLIIVDINQECIDYCKERFRGNKKISYLKNDGFSLRGIKDGEVSLVYSFDSMVHFDSEVIKEYLKEFHRVLKPGGHCFCHHSNYTGNPDGHFMQSPHWRNFMSKELFAHYSAMAGLEVIEQRVIDWGYPELDCLTLLQKPVGLE